MAVKPITGMLRRGLVLDLSVAFGMPSLRARAPATPPEDGYAVSVDYGKRASKQAGSQMRCLSWKEREWPEGRMHWMLATGAAGSTTNYSERLG